jgi:hypothetical protein
MASPRTTPWAAGRPDRLVAERARPGRSANSIRAVAAPAQRRALGALFAVLALAFGGIAVAAGAAGQWVILASAAALTLWMAGLALRALRP